MTLEQAPLRRAMIEDGARVLTLSAVLVILMAGLLFAAVRVLIVRPIQGVIEAMRAYAAAPEDARALVAPGLGHRTARGRGGAGLPAGGGHRGAPAEGSPRLAGRGRAKVSHDLRNILASAQLFADRLEETEDPTVRRLGPKIVASLCRAIALCESTLAFGRVDEPPPRLGRCRSRPSWPR